MAHADALLSRWVGKALKDPNTKWANVFFTLIKDFTWENRRAQNRAQYTNTDCVLFGTPKTYGTLHYAIDIWNTCEALRCHLLLSPDGNFLPTQWHISDIIHALHPFAALNNDHTLSLNKTLGKLGVTSAEHL